LSEGTKRSDGRKTFAANNQLRRENNRLRKQVQRLNRLINEFGLRSPPDPDDVEADPLPEVEPTIDLRLECPKCNKQGKELNLGRYVYLTCPSCGFRDRL